MAIKKRIIFAAGHGDGDNGAAAQGTTEFIENIQITDLAAHYLRQAGGFEVHVVPHTLNLAAQIAWVNARWGGLEDGIAVEIHKNAGGGTGSEVWTPSHPDATARKFSQSIADHLAKETGLRNRGVKEAQNNRWGRLGWCDDVKMYACLVEAGFIDVDPTDDRTDKKYAAGIVNGILAYFGSKPAAQPSAPAAPPASNNGKKSNDTIAQEVIDMKWGVNPDRSNRLRAAGYDANAIQALVNQKLNHTVSAPAQSSGGSIKVGSTVTVSNPVDVNGTRLAVSGQYKVMELKGSRAVIGKGGAVTAAINVANLKLVGGGSSPAPAKAPTSISVGNKVTVTNPVDVNGTRLAVSGTYDVLEVSGDRVVIGKGRTVTAAINKSNLRRA